MGDFDELEAKVLRWADDRGIFSAANPQAQLLKTLEELGEVAHALARGDQDALVDGVGDVMVTLILFATMNNFSVTYALGEAYDEIKDRQGKMQGGFFVKSEG